MKPSLVFSLLAFSLIMPNLVFAETGTSSVDVDETTFDVTYDATGLTVDGMEADISFDTLSIFITTTDAAPSLEITLERSFFDSQTDGEDDDFIVVADFFTEAQFEETKTDTARILTIDVPEGTNVLEITGTSFGSAEMPEETEAPIEGTEEPMEETTTEEPTEEPEMQCGPGTMLKDGVCVLEEEPVEETTTEEPEMQCGPGTTLQGGVCVLDETCGPGTILKDGVCVLAPAPQPTGTSRGGAFQMMYGLVAAFVIAFIVMIVLWAIGRASRKNN